jgi:hypothetical protein
MLVLAPCPVTIVKYSQADGEADPGAVADIAGSSDAIRS